MRSAALATLTLTLASFSFPKTSLLCFPQHLSEPSLIDFVTIDGTAPLPFYDLSEAVHSPRVSAFTSRREETDETPCLSASGEDLCLLLREGKIRSPNDKSKSSLEIPLVCATNDYPFRSRLLIFGLGDCIVLDRMNTRYSGKAVVDIYFGFDLLGAKSFGIKQLDILPLK